jgi:2,4-dienoyl-CoA reductase-like NADH-dependent reductase (Old Yellow Enzyme family)
VLTWIVTGALRQRTDIDELPTVNRPHDAHRAPAAPAFDPSRYPALFAPLVLPCGARLKNRVTHASMTTRLGRDQGLTDQQIRYYANRAKGGCGLIVTEPLNSWREQKNPYKARVWNDDHVDALQRWAEAVESEDCRLLGQIQDPGRGRHERGRNPIAVGVSSLHDDLSWTVPHVLSADEIRRMIDDFAQSSARLERCGFSGVEISAGHGHLFHQFMSAWSNERDDEYGGPLENRLRVVRELIDAIRAATKPGFIVGLKLPGDDGVPNGIGPAEAAELTPPLVTDGKVDYVCYTWGAHARSLDMHIPDMHWPRIPFLGIVKGLRAAVGNVPMMAVGLITDPAEAEGIVARGDAELIALGRPLVTDPAWPLKAGQGRVKDIRYCVSCNTCWGTIMEHRSLACDNNPRVAAPEEVDYWPAPAAQRKRIVVVGSGIAAMEAAWVAAARGHDVTVFGASSDVGGKTRLHARLPGGENLSSIYDYQAAAARRAGVKLELGVRADVADVAALQPDLVFVATGSTMTWPRTLPRELQAEGFIPDLRALMTDLVDVSEPQGGTAVLFDMDHTEGTYAAAELLRRLFDRAVIVTPRDRIAEDTPLVTRLGILRRVAKLGIEILPLNEPDAASRFEDGVFVGRNVYTGDLREIDGVSLFTYSTPRRADDALAARLRAAGLTVRLVGDAWAPRTVSAATSDGHAAGHEP